MRALRLIAILVIAAAGLALWPRPAAAATAGTFELKLDWWPATDLDTYSGGSAGWITQFYGGDFRWTSDRQWGVHLKYDTGSEGSYTGCPGCSGTDTVWSGDVFYAWQIAAATVRGFVGYGSMQLSEMPANSVWTNAGWRFGADTAIPLAASNFSFNASAAVYPSSTATLVAPAGTSTAASSATDFAASVQYTWPSGWLVEAGYRWLTWQLPNPSCTGGTLACTVTQSGPVFSVGYRW